MCSLVISSVNCSFGCSFALQAYSQYIAVLDVNASDFRAAGAEIRIERHPEKRCRFRTKIPIPKFQVVWTVCLDKNAECNHAAQRYRREVIPSGALFAHS